MGSEDAPTQADLLAQVDATLRNWQQGDVLDAKAFRHTASAELPATDASREAVETRDLSGLITVATEVEAVVIISHTCDLASHGHEDAPYIVVAPVCTLDDVELRNASRGNIPRYAAVTWLADDAFADLHRAMTVERPVAAGWNRTHECVDADDQRKFGRQLERYFGRFAFPNDLAHATKSLKDRIRDKTGKSSPEGQLLDLVYSVRVTARPNWNSDSIEVVFLFALYPRVLGPDLGAPIDESLSAWLQTETRIAEIARRTSDAGPLSPDYPHLWVALAESWVGLCRAYGVISSFDVSVDPLDEITAETYLASDPFDVDYLSAPPE